MVWVGVGIGVEALGILLGESLHIGVEDWWIGGVEVGVGRIVVTASHWDVHIAVITLGEVHVA